MPDAVANRERRLNRDAGRLRFRQGPVPAGVPRGDEDVVGADRAKRCARRDRSHRKYATESTNISRQIQFFRSVGDVNRRFLIFGPRLHFFVLHEPFARELCAMRRF